MALPIDSISRDDAVEELGGDFDEEEVLDAFSALVDENRLCRIGNNPDYVMVERDLF